MNAKRFINYTPEPSEPLDPVKCDYHLQIVSKGVVAIESLEDIRQIIDSRDTPFNEVEQSLVDASIDAVLKDFSTVEVESVALECALALEDDDDEPKEKKQDVFIVRMIKRIWKWISDSLKWLAKKLGFSSGETAKQKKAVEKAKETRDKLVAFIDSNEKEVSRAVPISLTDNKWLDEMAGLNKDLSIKDILDIIQDQEDMLVFAQELVKNFDTAQEGLRKAIVRATTTGEIKDREDIVTSMSFLGDMAKKSFNKDFDGGFSSQVVKEFADTNAIMDSVRASPLILSGGGGKAFIFEAKITDEESVEDVNTHLFFYGQAQANRKGATVKNMDSEGLKAFAEKVVDLRERAFDITEKSVKDMDTLRAEISGFSDLAAKNAASVESKYSLDDTTKHDLIFGIRLSSQIAASMMSSVTKTALSINMFFDRLHHSCESLQKLQEALTKVLTDKVEESKAKEVKS